MTPIITALHVFGLSKVDEIMDDKESIQTIFKMAKEGYKEAKNS
ncbi:hypothetical protein [Nostoc sp. C117]